jgi:hypothetical protein
MNKLFYIIYNSYYKHGEYKDDIPSLTVGGIFTISIFSVARFFSDLIGWFKPSYFEAKQSNIITVLLTFLYGLIVYILFYHNKRYQKIYAKYKNNTFLNSKTAKFIGFSLVIIMIMSPIFLAALHTKIKYGWWIKIK